MQNNTEDKKEKRPIVSEILPSGEIIELVYKENYKQTMLAVFNGQEVKYEEFIERPNEIIFPYSGKKELISKKVVMFPSEAMEYGSTSELLGKIRTFIYKYVGISPRFWRIATYYVLLTWVYDRFNELPYLRAIGDFGSGKSRFQQVIGSLCYKPIFAGGATSVSPIFRIIDQFKGTLIIDEADYRLSDAKADIIKILNSGYQKGVPVLRSEGQGTFEVRAFDVFCPKILATREQFEDDALESRFLIEEMDKMNCRDDIPLNLPDSFAEEALEIRNQLLMWRFKNLKEIKLSKELIDRSLEPRLNQIITPLMSVIDEGDLREELKGFIKECNRDMVIDRGMRLEADVLKAVLQCFGVDDAVTIKRVTDTLNAALELTGTTKMFKPKKVGVVLRKKLKMKVSDKPTREGYTISLDDNKERLEALKKFYNIAEEPGEQVNVVNITEDVSELSKQAEINVSAIEF